MGPVSFVFFDTETTGLKHGFDQIVHFEPGHDFARAKRPRGGVDLHSRPARLPLGRPVGARDGEVNLARPDRREIVQCQRRFVRHDGAGRARLEPGRDDVLMGLSGKLDESIESATLALEVLGPDMVPECPTIVADGVRLGRGEVSTLCGGEVEELAPSLKPCWHGHSGEYVVNWSYFIRLIHDIARDRQLRGVVVIHIDREKTPTSVIEGLDALARADFGEDPAGLTPDQAGR